MGSGLALLQPHWDSRSSSNALGSKSVPVAQPLNLLSPLPRAHCPQIFIGGLLFIMKASTRMCPSLPALLKIPPHGHHHSLSPDITLGICLLLVWILHRYLAPTV